MPNSLVSSLAIVLAASRIAAARVHSLPEDPHAFPKFKVTFLNNLPVLNETAQKWLNQGIPGGEPEFLNQPWNQMSDQSPFSPKEIDDGFADQSGFSSSPLPSENNAPYSLEHMKMGPRDSYLCLVPNPLDLSPPSEDDLNEEITPARSWALLNPLSERCLYHRQGWFTYSYCHNDQIRQFRELPQAQSHIPGKYFLFIIYFRISWESYTLGKAPATPEPGADLTVAERNAIEANLELARGAGSRYLVQRWNDGTLCDKTGKGREVEVQFHCSMAMSDHILFVKEAKTCSYILVINTPRLCGEPGFRSHRDVVEQAQIRCREIVHSQPEQFHDVPETDHPQKIPRVKKALPPQVAGKGGSANDEIIRTLEAFLGGKVEGQVIVQQVGDADMMIEFLNEEDFEEYGDVMDNNGLAQFADALRAAGYEVLGDTKAKQRNDEDDGAKKKEKGSDSKGSPSKQKPAVADDHLGHPQARDEL
ncbi:hypothetical protein BDP27DRAFT_1221642 [Rhodocollybia butyracea]|uniref:Protein OS-9 homolog n=1 Tax=Rhodocollybia butyracea TaxID=206335 RepID=A0A9P5U7G8_9AGAR|nr:hypothetical protein BDP27DRAFT_1221642 [Rhodocollybia butyracea]